MKFNKNQNEEKKNKSTDKKEKTIIKNHNTNSLKDIRFIQTNYYLNDYNFYNKNNLKMLKLREEKIKEHKKKIDTEKKNNLMPKMLYFNKFINSETKRFSKNIFKSSPNTLSKNEINNLKYLSNTHRNEDYNTIKNAIITKSIEQKSKRHIKRTIKAFDELLTCVDGLNLRNRDKRLQMMLNNNKDFDNNNNKDNNENDDDEFNVENYNFDEYKQKYKNEKIQKRNNTSQTGDIIDSENAINDIDMHIDEHLIKNIQYRNNDNIYITAPKTDIDENKTINDSSMRQNKSTINKEKRTKNKIKFNNKFLTINNMIVISDDSLVKQIKNLRKNFKKELYFNTNNFGKFKITEPGLNYPNSFDKNRKYPEYKGNDVQEKIMFNYKSKVTNPRYNYNNIGTFNEKFNRDLSDISNFYGKEQAKGRFLRNPLISMFSKYIPNYELYKDLKFIENRYTSGNKYLFRLKPIINKSKNNFDRLASNIYNKGHKLGYFE